MIKITMRPTPYSDRPEIVEFKIQNGDVYQYDRKTRYLTRRVGSEDGSRRGWFVLENGHHIARVLHELKKHVSLTLY